MRTCRPSMSRPWASPINARPDDIHQDARREVAALETACSSGPAPVPFVTIRVYSPPDTSALNRLAPLDSSHVSAGPFLLAEIGGELRAALSLTDGAILADPFYPTAAVVQLLVIREQQVGGNRPAQKRRSQWAITGRPGRYRKAKPPPHRSFHDSSRPAPCACQAQSLDRAGLPKRRYGRVDGIPSRAAADPGRADCRVQDRLKPRAAHLHLRSAGTHTGAIGRTLVEPQPRAGRPTALIINPLGADPAIRLGHRSSTPVPTTATAS